MTYIDKNNPINFSPESLIYKFGNVPNFLDNVLNSPLLNYMSNYSLAPLKGVDSFERSTQVAGKKAIRLGLDFNFEGYNIDLGKKIAETALKNSGKFSGKCARYVKKAIVEAGAGEYVSGHAYTLTDTLSNNKNFKQIPKNTPLEDLPAGCVLVYGKGVAGYSSKYGHTEITTGDGRAVSDGITNNLHKKPSAIFMPV